MSVCVSPEALAELIVIQAGRFVGLREVKPNAKWDNPKTPGPDAELVKELRALMQPTPWQDGWAYCAAFCEGMVASAISRVCGLDEIKRFRAVMTAGVLVSRNNFRDKGLLSQAPVRGAIWLAQHGTSAQGHAGIVNSITQHHMQTIEANTSLDSTDPAKDREGDWITRRGPFPIIGRGTLKTVGFVTPAAIIKLISAA